MEIKMTLSIIAPVLTTLIAFLLNKYFYNKPHLIAYYAHISDFIADNQGQRFAVHTHAVVIRNTGKVAAKNVRVGHRTLNGILFNIKPQCCYELKDIPGDGKEIIFPTLVPSEQVEISYLYFPPTTFRDINIPIKSDEGFAKVIEVIPTPSLQSWQKIIFYTLLFIGCSTVIYWVGILIIFHSGI